MGKIARKQKMRRVFFAEEFHSDTCWLLTLFFTMEFLLIVLIKNVKLFKLYS